MRKTCGDILMIKFLIHLFFAGLALSAPVESRLLAKCQKIFRSLSATDHLSNKAQWAYPQSQLLFNSVYQQMSFLKGLDFSPAEINFFQKRLEETIHYIENSKEESLKNRLDFMEPHFSSAVEAFPLILSFINQGGTAQYKALGEKSLIQLLLSALSRHTLAYLRHPQAEKLDWPRINLILNHISEFKEKPNVWTLYKIKRAVLQKYSLKEYINCK